MRIRRLLAGLALTICALTVGCGTTSHHQGGCCGGAPTSARVVPIPGTVIPPTPSPCCNGTGPPPITPVPQQAYSMPVYPSNGFPK